MAAKDPKPIETPDQKARQSAMRERHQAGGVGAGSSAAGSSGAGAQVAGEAQALTNAGVAREGGARDAPPGESSAERSDRLYADYRAAMLFFGETPGPQAKPPKDQPLS